MRKNKKFLFMCSITLLCVISMSSIVFASSYDFGANMEYRYVNGKNNGVTYSIGKDKKISISGTAGCYSYSSADHEGDRSGYLCATQPTSILLCETTTLGARRTICYAEVTISGVGETKKFSSSGTSKYSSKKYMYMFKGLNDGRNLSISGKISY